MGNMLWLDSAFPLDKPVTDPGVQRGNCPGGESSTPTDVRQNYPNGYARFTNAAIGEIGSTTTIPVTPLPTPVTLAPSPAPADCTLERRVTTCNSAGGTFECNGCGDVPDLDSCCACEGATTAPTMAPTQAPTQTPPTMAPTQSPTQTPTTQQICKSWCKSNSKGWDKKCSWAKCSGCPECSGRRLRGSTDDDAQVWL